MRALSIVIIGRNEETHIQRCLKSVMAASRDLKDVEVLYVDSASTDNTIELAKSFPINIVQLKPDCSLSASAGRYIGYLNTSGEYILFVDGDTILYKDWLPEGLKIMDEQTEIGGLAGMVHEISEDAEGRPVRLIKNRHGNVENFKSVYHFGGIGLYRRNILDQVGPFNPWLSTDEEPELSIRLRKAGYKLIQILKPMAITYNFERQSFWEVWRRFSGKLYTYGKTWKYCQANGHFMQYAKERMGIIIQFVIVATSSLIILLGIILLKKLILFFLFVIGVFLLFLIWRRGNIKGIAVSFFLRTTMSLRTIQSYLSAKVKKIEDYPVDVIQIKKESGR